jgi:hypothetical protein
VPEADEVWKSLIVRSSGCWTQSTSFEHRFMVRRTGPPSPVPATRVHVIACASLLCASQVGMMIYNRHARELATRGRHPIV